MRQSFEVAAEVGPGLLQSSFNAGTFTGIVGGAGGAVAGLFRSVNPVLFGVASGLQCFTFGASYWMAKQGQLAYRASHDLPVTPQDRVKASAIAGGVSGATVASIFRGRRNIIPGVVVFSGIGFLGQIVYNTLQQQRADRLLEAPEAEKSTFLQRVAQSRFTPVKFLTDEDYEDMLREKLIRIEAEIALVDEDIEHLKQSPPEDNGSGSG